MNPDAIPVELRERRQWVIWRHEQVDGRETKRPYIARPPQNRGSQAGVKRRFPASTTNPSSWRSFEEALVVLRDAGDIFDGIGYALSPDDPFCGLDLDLARRPDGELHPAAAELIGRRGSYCEVTPSGLGLRVLARAKLRSDRHSTTSPPWSGFVASNGRAPELAAYSEARFFTITGDVLPGFEEITAPQDALDAVLAELLPAPSERPSNGACAPASAHPLDLSDAEPLFVSPTRADLRRSFVDPARARHR